jgi:hypothetical protein
MPVCGFYFSDHSLVLLILALLIYFKVIEADGVDVLVRQEQLCVRQKKEKQLAKG